MFECLACGLQGRFWTRKAGRDIWHCLHCRLVWVPEGLVVSESGASIYEGETPVFLQDGNEVYYLDDTNLLSCRQKLEWVSGHVRQGARLLDAGANFGHFLSIARARFSAVGVDLSRAAVQWSREHFDVENHAASIYDLPTDLCGPYEAVTLFDVIEHVPDPGRAIDALKGVLAPGGHLFLSTPDAGSVVARAMGSRWHYLDPIQHIVLFNRKNLSELLDRSGFEVIGVRTLGHHYRMGYVLDRLSYLNDAGMLGGMFAMGRVLGKPLASQKLYLNLGDVMGLVARVRTR